MSSSLPASFLAQSSCFRLGNPWRPPNRWSQQTPDREGSLLLLCACSIALHRALSTVPIELSLSDHSHSLVRIYGSPHILENNCGSPLLSRRPSRNHQHSPRCETHPRRRVYASSSCNTRRTSSISQVRTQIIARFWVRGGPTVGMTPEECVIR